MILPRTPTLWPHAIRGPTGGQTFYRYPLALDKTMGVEWCHGPYLGHERREQGMPRWKVEKRAGGFFVVRDYPNQDKQDEKHGPFSADYAHGLADALNGRPCGGISDGYQNGYRDGYRGKWASDGA